MDIPIKVVVTLVIALTLIAALISVTSMTSDKANEEIKGDGNTVMDRLDCALDSSRDCASAPLYERERGVTYDSA